MAKREVTWSRTAYLQRKNILYFWVENNFSTTYSIKLLKLTKEITEIISIYPEMGKTTDIENIRCFVFERYSLYYKFSEIEIHIVCFWDNNQNPKIVEILLSLLNE
jgi:toxin YoeB